MKLESYALHNQAVFVYTNAKLAQLIERVLLIPTKYKKVFKSFFYWAVLYIMIADKMFYVNK
ncbi:hypothetical protein CHH47_28405 [Priestia megaterium]|nr:hypothetical protein CHH47_28405 [Priestia megaterium]